MPSAPRPPVRALVVKRTELDRKTPGSGKIALQRWADSVPVGPAGLFAAGAALAGAGILAVSVLNLGFWGAAFFSGLFTVGGGLAFLGLDRVRRARQAPDAPSPSEQAVLAERARRLRTVLEARGQATFDDLRRELGWTDEALVAGLLHLRDQGGLAEDLDLDTGQWVYRADPGEASAGTSALLTLDDRAKKAGRDR